MKQEKIEELNKVEDEFDKIIGYEQIKNELRRISDILVNPKKYEKFGVKVSQGLLLHGEPGVGKTLMAQCFINSTKRNFYICRKNKSNGSFIKEITRVFEEAQANQPSIIFLDDMDKFSNEDPFHSDTDEYVTIQSCIDEIKGKDVFVVATVNNIRNLPKSLKRDGRFSHIIEVEYAEDDDSEKIIEYYLKQKKNLGNINVKEFAQIMVGMTCAEIENITNEAAIYAAYHGKEKIGKDELLHACLRKIFEAPEDDKFMYSNFEEKQYVAYHEAGHAVVAEYFKDKSISLLSIAKHKGDIGGITVNCRNNSELLKADDIREQICRKLGGRAAIEVVFGDVDTGSNSDIHTAYKKTVELMDNYCSYGFDKFLRGPDADSEGKKVRLEQAVSDELERLYTETKKIIIKNREFLDKLASNLIERTTLMMSEIHEIKSTCKFEQKKI